MDDMCGHSLEALKALAVQQEQPGCLCGMPGHGSPVRGKRRPIPVCGGFRPAAGQSELPEARPGTCSGGAVGQERPRGWGDREVSGLPAGSKAHHRAPVHSAQPRRARGKPKLQQQWADVLANADFSDYKGSMRPLLEKDRQTVLANMLMLLAEMHFGNTGAVC